jgi:hypothetical protein
MRALTSNSLYRALDPTGNADYDNLPEDIKVHVTPKEFLWMGEQGRSRLMRDFTEPDYVED